MGESLAWTGGCDFDTRTRSPPQLAPGEPVNRVEQLGDPDNQLITRIPGVCDRHDDSTHEGDREEGHPEGPQAPKDVPSDPPAEGMAANKYHFPILEISDIVRDLNMVFLGPESQIKEGQLQEPINPEVMRNTYVGLIGCFNIKHEQLTQVQLDEDTDHPELYEMANYYLKLCQCLQRLLLAAGAENFCLHDLLEPKTKRTVRFLSAMINFLNFIDTRNEVVKQIESDAAAVQSEYEGTLNENEELRRRINQIKMARQQQEPEIAQLKASMNELNSDFQEKQQKGAELTRLLATRKAGISERKNKLAHLKCTSTSLKEEIKKIAPMIVQSPARMKIEMDRKEEQLCQIRNTRQERFERLLELKEKDRSVGKYEVEISNCLKQVTAVKSLTEQERELLAKCQGMNDQKEEIVSQYEDLTKREQQLKQMINAKQDKISKLTLQHDVFVTSMKENIDANRRDREVMRKHGEKEMAEVRAIQQRMNKMKEEDEQRNEQHENDMEKMAQYTNALITDLEAHHVALFEAAEVLEKKQQQDIDTSQVQKNQLMT